MFSSYAIVAVFVAFHFCFLRLNLRGARVFTGASGECLGGCRPVASLLVLFCLLSCLLACCACVVVALPAFVVALLACLLALVAILLVVAVPCFGCVLLL